MVFKPSLPLGRRRPGEFFTACRSASWASHYQLMVLGTIVTNYTVLHIVWIGERAKCPRVEMKGASNCGTAGLHDPPSAELEKGFVRFGSATWRKQAFSGSGLALSETLPGRERCSSPPPTSSKASWYTQCGSYRSQR